MSIVRAFTTRRKQPEFGNASQITVGRAASQRNGRPVHRSQISSPVALVSTTNMLSYDAPDIVGSTPVEFRVNGISSAATIISSSEESDAGSGSVHSRETVTDMSSVEASPTTSDPDANHLSMFFKAPATPSVVTPSRSPSIGGRSNADAPYLPRRAPSHSKRAHEVLSKKRSLQRAMSPPSTGREIGTPDTSKSTSSAFVEAPREHPFVKEIAQLDAVAEEYGRSTRNAESDSDATYMHKRGLGSYDASEYLSEIHALIDVLLDEDRSPSGPDFSGWF